MSITLQVAGYFLESNEICNNESEIYFSHKFALYFYRDDTLNNTENISASFNYISEEEYKNNKLSNGREFKLYDNKPDLLEKTYNLDETNVIIPINIVTDCINVFEKIFSDINPLEFNKEFLQNYEQTTFNEDENIVI